MKRIFPAVFIIVLSMGSCTMEFNCTDPQIQPAFINFSLPDLDTLVLRKFQPGNNYQILIDTFSLVYGYNAQYVVSNDTTTVFVIDGTHGIKAGYDWQLFIPTKNRIIFISDILSEKKTGTCGSGIFSMDKFGCTCLNNVFSFKKDNQLINFSTSDPAGNYIFIR